jgi:hypothetical protein
MKRSAKLIALSREHHGALSLALAARRAAASGDAEGVAAAGRRVVSSFGRELEPHFQEEEDWLLPDLERAGAAALVARTLAEHAELRALAASLAQPDAATLARFGERLAAHVRFEERELFEAYDSLVVGHDDHRSG